MNIANWALKLLPLENVWWIVSKRNPLKKNIPNDFAKRLEQTKRLVSGSNMLVKDIENKFDINYTIDLLSCLKKEHTDTNFVWLMGADSMFTFHEWKDWQIIFQMVPIVIFARPGYNGFWSSIAASKYKGNFVRAEKFDLLNKFKTPIWTFFDTPEKDISSTEIRNKNKL